MRNPWIRQGIWAGLTAAGAGVGVLVGLGRGHGRTFQPLNLLARPLVGGRADLASGFVAGVTLPGVLVLLIGLVILGLVLARLAGRASGARVVAAACILTALAILADHVLLPVRVAPRLDGLLSRPELILVFVVMALGLAIGARTSIAPGRPD